MPKVEIYAKTTCSYCIRARALLDRKNANAEVTIVDQGGPKRDEMIARAGGRMTVPQIFIGGKHIGGCDDLVRLDQSGRLDELLAA